MTWTPSVKQCFTPDTFREYVKSLALADAAWKPQFVVLHNTGTPNLLQRPAGFTSQHMSNFDTFYRDQQHWSAGPHLFIDDIRIWAYTPLTHPGVHSPSWNAVSWGVEMLGDYDTDVFKYGRGANVRANAADAIATLMTARGWPADVAHLRLHHEDPLTTHHDCPGANVAKPDMLSAIAASMKSNPAL